METEAFACHELAQRIESIYPEAAPGEVARLCLLIANLVDDLDALADEEVFDLAWKEVGLRLQAATDQHAAMTEELEELAGHNPEKFTLEQIRVLMRALKVQSLVLQLYVGQPDGTEG